MLVSFQNPQKISLKHFAGLMKYYKPKMSKFYINAIQLSQKYTLLL